LIPNELPFGTPPVPSGNPTDAAHAALRERGTCANGESLD